MNVHAPSPLRDALRLSVVESKIARIRADAADIESTVGLVAELRRVSPVSTPILDLRMAARALRLAALKLDEIAAKQHG
jgi:hypothetical protein